MNSAEKQLDELNSTLSHVLDDVLPGLLNTVKKTADDVGEKKRGIVKHGTKYYSVTMLDNGTIRIVPEDGRFSTSCNVLFNELMQNYPK